MVREGEPEILIDTRTRRALAVLALAEIQEDGSKNRRHRFSHLRTMTLPDQILHSSCGLSNHGHKQQSKEASISELAVIVGGT